MNEHDLSSNDLEKIAGGAQNSSEKSEPCATFGASRVFHITPDQFELLKKKNLINKDGKLLHEDAPKAAEILGITAKNLNFMYLGYKAPEFAEIDIIK